MNIFSKKILAERENQKNIELDFTLEELFSSEKGNLVRAIWFTVNMRVTVNGASNGKKESVNSGNQDEIIITIHKGKVVLKQKQALPAALTSMSSGFTAAKT